MLFATALLWLSGCSLPRGAGVEAEILAGADKAQADFAVYSVTRSFLPQVARWPRTGGTPSSGWISQQRRAGDPVIEAGDRISLEIWDYGENSLLTSPGQKTVAMKDMLVSGNGTIFVPYLDEIRVAGLTPDQARKIIQTHMETIAPSAQVQLAAVSGRRNAVDLVGGVARPGNYPLPEENMTVLNLVSLGGGIPETIRNPQVRLMRQGRVYATSLGRLYDDPGLDTVLKGDDKVIIEPDDRYFLSLGAAKSEKIVYFEKENISALDAMSLIGGLNDSRANPKGILILRQYPDKAVRKDGKGPGQARAIFTIDLTSADGLFSAGQFSVNPGDLVLVTESPINSATTAANLLRLLTATANSLKLI